MSHCLLPKRTRDQWDGAGMDQGWNHSSIPGPSGQGSVPPWLSGRAGRLGMDLWQTLAIKSLLLLNRIFPLFSCGCSCPNPSQFFSSPFPGPVLKMALFSFFLLSMNPLGVACWEMSLSLCAPQLWGNHCTGFQFPPFSIALTPPDTSFLLHLCIWKSHSQASNEFLFPSFFS